MHAAETELNNKEFREQKKQWTDWLNFKSIQIHDNLNHLQPLSVCLCTLFPQGVDEGRKHPETVSCMSVM